MHFRWGRERDSLLLQEYLHGHLPIEQARRVALRLAQEPKLAQQYRELMQVRQALRQLPQLEPPRNFIIVPAHSAQPHPASASTRWLVRVRWSSAVAASLFIMSLAGGWWSGQRSLSGAALMVEQPSAAQIAQLTTEPAVRSAAGPEQALTDAAAAGALPDEQIAQAPPLPTATSAIAVFSVATDPMPDLMIGKTLTATTDVETTALDVAAGKVALPTPTFAPEVLESPAVAAPLTVWQWLQIVSGAALLSLLVLLWVMARLRA